MGMVLNEGGGCLAKAYVYYYYVISIVLCVQGTDINLKLFAYVLNDPYTLPATPDHPAATPVVSTPKFVVPPCKTTTHQRSFWIRSIRTWNTLADKLDLSMISLNFFKSVMFSYYFTGATWSENILVLVVYKVGFF